MPVAQPLLLAIYQAVLERGGHPLLLPGLPGADEVFFRFAGDAQLDYISPVAKMVVDTFDVSYRILSESNTKDLSTVDGARMARFAQSHHELQETFMRRQATGDLRWSLTLFPTEAYAQDAEMSLREYEDFVYGACLLDDSDPVARWREVSARQQKLVDWLRGKKMLRVTGPHCDLTVGVNGRIFINADGTKNFPDGEIFTGPQEDVTEGHVEFTYPAIFQGREVEGIGLTFQNGRVTKALAKKGEDFLLKMLDTDEGARVLGEFAIGTNTGIRRFTRNILFDEKLSGTIHMALGASYPDTGGKNQSAIHWDMICDMRDGGEITVDGAPFYKSGEFLI
jgi:aminopeptidase